MKLNCWEFKKCGREPDGENVEELGVCIAAIKTKLDKINDGKNGGRACWVVAGTLCKGKPQGSFVHKIFECLQCDFYKKVLKEEGENFVQAKQLIEILNK